MAGLFNSCESPRYLSADGQTVSEKRTASFLGLFPGTPEYVQPSTREAPLPAPPAPPFSVVVPRTGDVPACPTMPAAGVEVRVRIPGLLDVHGTLSLPPNLPDLLPVLLPLLAQRLASAMETHGDADDAGTATSPSMTDEQTSVD
jgi:hypothetical protein